MPSDPARPLAPELPELAGPAQVFQQLAMTRRSVRTYQARPVPRELTSTLIDLATRAPSNFNRQPWQFIVADSPEWISAINGLLARALAEVEKRDNSGDLFHLLDHVRSWLYPLQTSAVMVLAFYKPSPERMDQQLSSVLEGGDVVHYNPNLISLGMAIQNLLLAAHAHGLSACMHSGPLAFLRGAINRLLKLPPNLQLSGLISIGYPAESPAAPPHRDLPRTLAFLDGAPPEAWAKTYAGETRP
jgi:nitroreductase